MSAICGTYNLDGKPAPREGMERMLKALAHHGPDGHGTWFEGPVGLGHSMLHTTPESLYEKLPQQDDEAGLVITADARIDNRDELFDALSIPHPARPRTPDGALILKAYCKWGEDCPNHLLGAFAFTIWDKKEQSLFCARDQMGFKPFYYYRSPRIFIFASEINGVLNVPEVPRRLNETAVAYYLVQSHEDREITFYEGILRLPSAHTLVARRTGELKKRRYWTLEPGPRLRLSSDDEYAEALRESISTATLSRLRSAYPVGVMLSGGLDSSAVACIAARGLRKQRQRLTAVCSVLPEDHSGPEVDEREYIEAVRSQDDNIDLAHVIGEGVTPFDDLEGQFLRMRRPSYDLFGYMTTALFRAGHERGVRVLLNGFGGDSAASFSGAGSLAQLMGRCVELFLGRSRSQNLSGLTAWRLLAGQLLSPLSPDFVFRFYRRIKGEKPWDWTSRYSIQPTFARRIGIDLPVRNRTLPRACDLIIKYVNSGQLQELLEEWASRGAALALEPRYPLLDKRLIEFCARVPPGQHVRGGHRRSLIRRAMEGVLPSEVQWRTTKEPFTPDYHRRVLSAKQQLIDFLRETGEEDIAWEYLSRTKIEQALERLKPWEAGTLWETDAQRIVGRGIEMALFVKWFDRDNQF